MRGCWRILLCGKVYACVCVCVNANAREEHLRLALTCTQSLCVCDCVWGCITDALWYLLLKWRAKGYPSVTSGEMWSGQLWRRRGDVCACVCVCFCVRLCLWWGCITVAFRCLLLKRRAKSDPIVMSNFVSVNCKCRSVSCDVLRAAVTCVCARVILCGYMFVFFCDFGYWMMNDEDAYAVILRSISCEQWVPLWELCIVVN